MVGVGAQIASCYSCNYCKSDNENYCPKMIHTYVSLLFLPRQKYHSEPCCLMQNEKYPDGVRTQGGYSNGIIAHEQFVFPIPTGLEPQYACSMLCGGLTVYSPLVRNGIGPGKKVGVVGIGGLVSNLRGFRYTRKARTQAMPRRAVLGPLCHSLREGSRCGGCCLLALGFQGEGH